MVIESNTIHVLPVTYTHKNFTYLNRIDKLHIGLIKQMIF